MNLIDVIANLTIGKKNIKNKKISYRNDLKLLEVNVMVRVVSTLGEKGRQK